MKKILFILSIFIYTSSLAQTESTFDEKLAKELGADEYGMKTYVFCLLKTGTNTKATENEQKIAFEGHMQNMNKLVKENKLIVAGPFYKNERNYRGIFIFNCSTIEEAEEWVKTDPAIIANLLEAELTLWYSSAALMKVDEIHDSIAKTKI
ncbi:YciI family protein [uncultured Flavobacterium sp.]|uniref:YciI family protein n=1 Tax=uncultured Flavobacterium sp. TaxID=165435 RepID=UPI0030C8838A